MPPPVPPGFDERLSSVAGWTDGGVSRETRDRLGTLVDLLFAWHRAQNLVAPATLADVWERHILDSAQVLGIAGGVSSFLDLGSGAGFPGLVIAILLTGRPGAHVHLVESNKRKAAFLQEVARTTGAPVTVHPRRVETLPPALLGGSGVITSRALAPLDRLLAWSEPQMVGDAVAVFHKGSGADAEIAHAAHTFEFDLIRHPSVTDPAASLLEVGSLRRREHKASDRAPGNQPG